jgi:hypothetical protein
MQKTIPFTIMALGLAAFAMPARAGIVDDTTLAPPGTYYGTGNEGTANWVVDNEPGVQLGLDTVIRFTNPVAPESATSNVYDVPLGNTTVGGKAGAAWGFAFSALNTSGLLSALTLSLSITDVLSGQTVSFNPATFLPDNSGTDGTNVVGGPNGCQGDTTDTSCVAATQKGIQNAEALSFANGVPWAPFDPTYDSSVNNSWVITLTATDAAGAVVGSVSERVNAGTGVPEPASMALLGSALLGLGAVRRRRRQG